MIPNLTDSLQLFFTFIADLISALDTVVFDMYGFRVSLWSIIFAFILVGIVANVWWKGAKG